MTTATEALDQIQKKVDAARADAQKFDSGTNAASTRVRKALQDIKEWAQSGRKAVSETVHERKLAKVTGK